jgi:hypothetical protein
MFYEVSLHTGMVLMMLLWVRVSMNSIVVRWTFIFVRENSATVFMVLQLLFFAWKHEYKSLDAKSYLYWI